MCVKKMDTEYCTHLAVNFGCNGEVNQGKTYGHEAGQAGNGVDLSKEQIQTIVRKLKVRPIVTYPYRPSIALTSSDDTPLVVKSGDELPPASWKMT